MLINGWAGSGGDAFPYYFRQAGLGRLIGMRTWGGLVGLSGNPSLIDGTSPSVPRFAFYELDGTWGVEGYGVPPDIEVVDDPAAMQDDGDPQLEAAVTHLMSELETWRRPEPMRPAGPDRSRTGLPTADR
jgi:tricorn protease